MCRYNRRELHYDPGTKYMLIDCGGGTVDIAVHEIDESGIFYNNYLCEGPLSLKEALNLHVQDRKRQRRFLGNLCNFWAMWFLHNTFFMWAMWFLHNAFFAQCIFLHYAFFAQCIFLQNMEFLRSQFFAHKSKFWRPLH